MHTAELLVMFLLFLHIKTNSFTAFDRIDKEWASCIKKGKNARENIQIQ